MSRLPARQFAFRFSDRQLPNDLSPKEKGPIPHKFAWPVATALALQPGTASPS